MAAVTLPTEMKDMLDEIKTMKKQENEYNKQMQKIKMDANIEKTFSDSLKQSANSVSRMGGQ